MFEYTINKEMSATRAKADAKERIAQIVMKALAAEFGEENVATVRVGNDTQTNTTAVRVGVVTEDGCEFDMCATADITVKEWQDRISSKTGMVYRTAFSFEDSVSAYSDWLADKAETEAKKKSKAGK